MVHDIGHRRELLVDDFLLDTARTTARETLHPVSYTHLDVYKRQGSERLGFAEAEVLLLPRLR